MRIFWIMVALFMLAAPAPARGGLAEGEIRAVIAKLQRASPPAERERAQAGVRQAATLWTDADGTARDFERFCLGNFVSGQPLDGTFARFESKLEAVLGHFRAMSVDVHREADTDTGPLLAVDRLFGGYSPEAHLADDLFQSKLAFTILLNFKKRTLAEALKEGGSWTRRDWAQYRLLGLVAHRVPGAALQKTAAAKAEADAYIADYKVFTGSLTAGGQAPVFSDGEFLVSHWGLRDKLKALYSDPAANLGKQKLLYAVMERIVTQEIPAAAIARPSRWDPLANTIDGKPAEREPDRRYAEWLDVFRANRGEDRYYPDLPTYLDRSFELGRGMKLTQAQGLIEAILDSDQEAPLAALIRKRLGRELLPFDIWYNGFRSITSHPMEELDRTLRQRYPAAQAFQDDLPRILTVVGFAPETARFLADHIVVESSRGSGRSMEPLMRGEKAHLYAQGVENGLNSHNLRTAMHELGHCVEHVFSLYGMDHYLLRGTPSEAFSEGFAFIMQAKQMEILGYAPDDDSLKALDRFSDSRQLAGVALVDIRSWQWLYAHPRAAPAEFKQAVLGIAREVWNRWFSPYYGEKDSPILAVYSHLVASTLYTPDYPVGFIVTAQVEAYFRQHGFASEMERVCKIGAVTPDEWMRQAVGSPVSARPLLDAAASAMRTLKQ
ncbi:MAG: hypothetical protein NTY77_19075 [Elusimicrobia bacterium]|nr:hypothetical protein [Elusimicrobiota bacterium]